ncbi:hypothetical protein SISSUDRAFT_1047462 [Sistotremastrum suecicum HHB10207 ss-3]|uniref:Uncharacterized protein n=1 Tax=Sistotremastrum suecicum HHB10207 ss-3 TaxID=1314776 RepID=A0A166D3U9_9AGAM|nr:hypothetical protein SISSUDRAFT_1047462 [Sistotremastrum suecicum HHB10207 ss-3]
MRPWLLEGFLTDVNGPRAQRESSDSLVLETVLSSTDGNTTDRAQFLMLRTFDSSLPLAHSRMRQ